MGKIKVDPKKKVRMLVPLNETDTTATYSDIESERKSASMQFKKDRKGKLKGTMSDFDVFVALFKSYCAINVLILPKNFENGGWLVGLLAIVFGGCLVCFCAHKLVQCAFVVDRYDFRKVVKRALGSVGCHVLGIILAVI